MGQCSSKPSVKGGTFLASKGLEDDNAQTGLNCDLSTSKKSVNFKDVETIHAYKARHSTGGNNALKMDAATSLDTLIRSRAASFVSTVSEGGSIGAVAAEAFSQALGAVLRDASPHKQHSPSRRDREKRSMQELPGAANASAVFTEAQKNSAHKQKEHKKPPPIACENEPPQPQSQQQPISECTHSLDGTEQPVRHTYKRPTPEKPLKPCSRPTSAATHSQHEHEPAAVATSPRASHEEAVSQDGRRLDRGVSSKKAVTFNETPLTALVPPASNRAVIRNKSRLNAAAGPTSSPEVKDSDVPLAQLTEQPTLVSHKSQPAPKVTQPPPDPAPPMSPQVPAAKGGPCEPGLWVLRRTGNVRSKYLLADSLGRGQFGSVCIAMDRKTGERWACKSVSKRRVQGMHDFSMTDVLREVEVLYTIGGHPGVVGLKEVYEDDEDLHLIMELCQGGDWFERLINFGRYTEAEAAATIRAVLEALAYCHSLNVIHRDIKPENIMFVDRSDGSAIKLTDFGLASTFQEGVPLTEVLGSAYYVAPEVLRESYGKESDIWSTGIVLFIALGGYAPFDGANEREVFTKILYEPLVFKDSSWSHISAGAKDIINKMLTKDPKQRATIKDLLVHPWLATCAGMLTPSTLPSPHGSITLPAAAAQALAAAVKSSSPSDSTQMDASFCRRLPRNSIAHAVASAVKKGKAVGSVPDAVVARLQQFTAMNAFKRQARRVLATFLPEEEVVGLLTVFKSMDKDGDGVLTVKELQAGLAERGVQVTDANAKLLIHRADLDGSGTVDYAEFLAATLHLARLERDERLYRAFRHFDTEGTGFITREALENCLQHVPRVNIDRILAEVDVDRDGRICYSDFCDMLRTDTEPALLAFAEQTNQSSAWGAFCEATESGRLVLALPPDSAAPSRNRSLTTSRQTSCNERTSYASMGAVSIRRSLGGNLLFGSRNARASGGTSITGRLSYTSQRPSYTGTNRPSQTGSSRFGSMRAAALMALNACSDSSGRSSIKTAGSGDIGFSSLGSPYTHRCPHSPTSPTIPQMQQLRHEMLEAVEEAERESPTSTPKLEPVTPVASLRRGAVDKIVTDRNSDTQPAGNVNGHAESVAFALNALVAGDAPETPTAWGSSPEERHTRASRQRPGVSKQSTIERRWSHEQDRKSPFGQTSSNPYAPNATAPARSPRGGAHHANRRDIGNERKSPSAAQKPARASQKAGTGTRETMTGAAGNRAGDKERAPPHKLDLAATALTTVTSDEIVKSPFELHNDAAHGAGQHRQHVDNVHDESSIWRQVKQVAAGVSGRPGLSSQEGTTKPPVPRAAAGSRSKP